MDAFFFTIAVFGFWVLLGRAVLTLCPTGLPALQQWLLAPAVGVSALLLPVFWLNRAGWPVKDFGVGLVISLALLSVLALWRKPPETPRKDLAIAGLILLGALLFAAWPMFRFGFAWVSFCNDDMANYCLAADRFLNHGFFEGPNLEDFLQGKDYTQAYWFMHVAEGVRAGSELILATACAFMGPMSAHQVFMPVIAALHLALLAASGAMALATPGSNKRAFWAMGLVSVSSLTILGYLYQLIAQVGGLALLISSVSLTFREFLPSANTKRYREILALIPGGLVLSALVINYPELMPFYGLGLILYLFVLLIKNQQKIKPTVIAGFKTALIVGVMSNQVLITGFKFLLRQAGATEGKNVDVEYSLFPYYLMPHGLVKLWGIQQINTIWSEPYQSALIFCAIIGLVYLTFLTVKKGVFNKNPSACVLLIQIILAIYLFRKHADFGLFKLAMFSQPFLWCSLIDLSLSNKPSKYNIRQSIIILLAVANMYNGFLYSIMSCGDKSKIGTGFTEIAEASRSMLILNLKKVFTQNEGILKNRILVLTTPNIVLVKFISLYAKGVRTILACDDFYGNIAAANPKKEKDYNLVDIKLKNGNKVKMIDNCDIFSVNNFCLNQAENQSIFNKYLVGANKSFSLQLRVPPSLVFKNSAFSHSYYIKDRRNIAFFQAEPDFLMQNQYFCGVGEHILFTAPNNLDQRVLLEITTTPLACAGVFKFPQIQINGQNINLKGAGAARIITPKVSLEKIKDFAFISIDAPGSAARFPFARPGLQGLYGRNIPMDYRNISYFCRGISLLSDEEYTNKTAPTCLELFPASLQNPDLEFSGIYEDGWVSGAAFFKLRSEKTSSILKIAGFVPLIDNPSFATKLNVTINNQSVFTKELKVGYFNIEVPIKQQHTSLVELAFDGVQILPKGDGRPVGGKLNFIGFE